MRAGHRSVALLALCLWPLACAVYDDQPQSQPGAGAAGKNSLAGSSGSTGQGLSGSATAGSTSSSTSGTPSVGGTAPTSGSGGDTSPSAGGDDEGGETTTGGSRGHGGNAGSSGSGGHGGVTSAGAANGGKSGAGGGHAGAGGTGGAATGGAGGTPASGGVAGTNGTAGMAGHAGNGGMPSGPLCSDHLLTARATWVPTASDFDTTKNGIVTNVLDNKVTRWSTGKPQAGDEWLQIDFGQTVTLNYVNLQQGDDGNDYPRGYAVIVSDTDNDLAGAVRLTGTGKSGVSTAISLPQLYSGRYLLIKQTSTSLSWWSVEEIEVSCAD